MSAQFSIGKLADPQDVRDAIHIAIAPVKANCTLQPGDHVGLIGGHADTFADVKVGIVDPFLKSTVKPGECFWLFLYPNTITSLNHLWTHPAFGDEGTVDTTLLKARGVIQELADAAGITFDEMIKSAADFAEYGEWRCDGGRWEGGPYAGDAFWDAYEIVTRKKVAEGQRGSIFTCSC